MKNEVEKIATEAVIFRFPQKPDIKGEIYICQPFYSEDGGLPRGWYCVRGLDGLIKPFPILGMSSLQSLTLGVQNILLELNNFKKSGGKVLFENGKDEYYLCDDFQDLIS